jgi:hypothetical protein
MKALCFANLCHDLYYGRRENKISELFYHAKIHSIFIFPGFALKKLSFNVRSLPQSMEPPRENRSYEFTNGCRGGQMLLDKDIVTEPPTICTERIARRMREYVVAVRDELLKECRKGIIWVIRDFSSDSASEPTAGTNRALSPTVASPITPRKSSPQTTTTHSKTRPQFSESRQKLSSS